MASDRTQLAVLLASFLGYRQTVLGFLFIQGLATIESIDAQLIASASLGSVSPAVAAAYVFGADVSTHLWGGVSWLSKGLVGSTYLYII
jgi:hypothetical protein